MSIGQAPAPPAATESGRPQALKLRHRNIGENDLEPAGNWCLRQVAAGDHRWRDTVENALDGKSWATAKIEIEFCQPHPAGFRCVNGAGRPLFESERTPA